MVFNVLPQESCSFILENAQKQYENGFIESIPQMLEGCIESGFTSEERLQAYKLVILSHIFNNNLIESDKEMLKFLKNYPVYAITETDPAEFIQLFNTYKTNAVSNIGAFVGLANPIISTIKKYNTSKFNPKIGFQGGISFSYSVDPKIDLSGGIKIMVSEWEKKFDSTSLNKLLINYSEVSNFLCIPLSVQYKLISYRNFDIWAKTGYELQYLLSASGLPELTQDNQTITEVEYDIKVKRNSLNHNILLSTMIAYNFGRNKVFVDFGFINSFSNQMKSSERYNLNNEIIKKEIFTYKIIDNDYKINNLYINIGYAFNFFKPEKK